MHVVEEEAAEDFRSNKLSVIVLSDASNLKLRRCSLAATHLHKC
jgi:hypothetical protein